MFLITSGSDDAGTRLLPQFIADAHESVESLSPYPCCMWYGFHPTSIAAASFSTSANGIR